MTQQGSGQQLQELLGSLLRNFVQAGQQAEQPMGLVRIQEINSVGCQTDSAESHSQSLQTAVRADTQDSSSQTNPFLDYDRPLSFDVGTQWEEMSTSSITLPSTSVSSRSTLSDSPSWRLSVSVPGPSRATAEEWRSPLPPLATNVTEAYNRRSLPSLPLTSRHAVNRLGSFPTTGQLPWEEQEEAAAVPRSSAPTRGPPSRSPSVEPPKKRGRPRKFKTGVKCRMCEEPVANKHVAPCNHFFCEKCIKGWLDIWNHCPKCGAIPIVVTDANFS